MQQNQTQSPLLQNQDASSQMQNDTTSVLSQAIPSVQGDADTQGNASQSPLLPKRKMSFKMILGMLGFVLLLVGGGAGFYLSQINQDVRQQASMVYPDECDSVGQCVNGKTCIFLNGRLQAQGAACSVSESMDKTGCYTTEDSCKSKDVRNCELSTSYATLSACEDKISTDTTYKSCYFTNNCNIAKIVSSTSCTAAGGWSSQDACQTSATSSSTTCGEVNGSCPTGQTCQYSAGIDWWTCVTPSTGGTTTGCFVTSDNCASQHPLNCEESNSFSTKSACQSSLGGGSGTGNDSNLIRIYVP